VAHPAMENAQQPGEQQPSWSNRTFRRDWVLREEWQQRGTAPKLTRGEKRLGAITVDRGQAGGDQRCFNCRGFGHMA